jgi:ADP-heptose:LPS heptosyltransferase
MASDRALLVAAGGGIGDTLLAGVVATALRSRYAAVDAVVLPEHRAIAERIPAIERVIPATGSGWTLGRALARERYAAAAVTWATARTAQIPLVAGIPLRAGQARRLYSVLFNRRVTVRSEHGDRTTPWTEILLDYARALDCDAPGALPQFAVRPDDRAAAAELLRSHAAGDRYAIVHPTRGLSATRARWPVTGFVELARALAVRDGLTVLVSGTAADAETALAIARQAGGRTISIAGETRIGTFAALAEGAVCVAAMDSGPMHVAAAVGAPTVGIFALQSDEPDRWAPRGARTAVVRASYPCPPAHRKETCPDFACVAALDTAAVLRAIDGLRVASAER